MGRGKHEIEKMENVNKKQVSFSKGSVGLFRKARELSIYCDAEIAMIIFSRTGKLFEFTSSSMLHTLKRYYDRLESTMPEKEHEAPEEEVLDEECQKVQTEDINSEFMKILGRALGGLDLQELQQFEFLINEGLLSVKGKKEQLLKEQLDQSREQEKEVMLDNKNLREEYEELRSYFPKNELPLSRYLNNQKPEHVASSQASACKSEADDGDSMTTLALGPPDNARSKRKKKGGKIFKSESPPSNSVSQTEN